MTNPIPEGHHTVTPFLVVQDAARMIDFMKLAFAAHETFRMKSPDGRVAHAEVKIGDSIIMLGEAPEERSLKSMLHLYVPDCDAVYKSALAAGATSLREPANQFYGDRSAGVTDFAGNQWWMATHMEDVSEQEMEKRMAAMAQAK